MAFFGTSLTRKNPMGLHLCYRLILPGDTAVDVVRQKLEALREFASTVGFKDVLGPSEYTVDELVELDHRDIVAGIASTVYGDPPDFYGVAAGGSCALAFVIVPGDECEPAAFGFIAPGSRQEPFSPEDDLHPGEWYWSACCKTQYASLISDEHLVACHAGLVKVLDHAGTLGITVQVNDETGYWDHRSADMLIERVGDMNRLMARFAGALSDKLGDAHSVEAPIFDHPDFERLEMEDPGSQQDQADGQP